MCEDGTGIVKQTDNVAIAGAGAGAGDVEVAVVAAAGDVEVAANAGAGDVEVAANAGAGDVEVAANAGAGDVEVGELNRGLITVQSVTSRRRKIREGNYPRANFFIRQSCQYFPGKSLWTYVYFHYFWIVYIALFCASFLLSFLHSIVGYVSMGLHGLFLLMFSQHLFVILTTMHHVLKQPAVVSNSIEGANKHIEIGLEMYRARYAVCSTAGIGFVTKETGKIQLQVFTEYSVYQMKATVWVSTLCFIAAFCMVFVCFGMASGTSRRVTKILCDA